MNIITIGSDSKILNKGSRTYLRVRDYANIVDTYTIFVFTKNSEDKGISDNNFRAVPVFGKNRFFQILKLFFILKKESKLRRVDTILSSQDPFEIGFVSWVASKLFGFKFHVQVHTEFFSPFFIEESSRRRLQYHIAKFVLKRANGIRVVSKRIQKYLIEKRGISESKIVCAPIYVENINIEHIEKDSGLIISISRLEKEKNFNRLIGAFENVALENLEIRLVIYGEGSKKNSIENRIAKSQFKERISLRGIVADPFKKMAEATVFAISSDYEGWGMTAVESVISGTPVCMTPVGCAGEFIVNCTNGFVSPDFSIESFAATLKKALSFNFDSQVMKKSLENMLSKEEYYNCILLSWKKTI